MINLLNNCSNNGTILDNGVCQCNPGVQLSDCSLVPDLLTIKVNVTLGPRGMAFYQLDLQGSDNIVISNFLM